MPMKYLRRCAQQVARRADRRPGSRRSGAAGLRRPRVTAPGHVRRVAPVGAASSRAATAASPSPLSTQSIAPSARAPDMSRATKRAVAADEDEAARQQRLGGPGEVDDLGHVGQVVAAKAHRVRPPLVSVAEVIPWRLDLEVDEPHVVARPAAPRRRPARGRAARGAGRPGCTSEALGWTASSFIRSSARSSGWRRPVRQIYSSHRDANPPDEGYHVKPPSRREDFVPRSNHRKHRYLPTRTLRSMPSSWACSFMADLECKPFCCARKREMMPPVVMALSAIGISRRMMLSETSVS